MLSRLISAAVTVVQAVAHQARKPVDLLRYQVKKRLGRIGPVQILAYRGHGNDQNWYLKGRVLEDKGISKASDHDNFYRNIRMMVRRFRSTEIPGVRLRARCLETGEILETITDEEGYFDFHFTLGEPPRNHKLWHDVEIELLDRVAPEQEEVRTTGRILVPPKDCDFGVISDVDDTIIETGATSFWKMVRITLMNNARSRLPFEGVAGFYRALRSGPSGEGNNPIFYVSSSPWNLYDLLVEFIDVHGIPMGPLFLRDLNFERLRLVGIPHSKHKLALIETLLLTYPTLPFILIGDSGQEDPEIYLKAVQSFPSRIASIYIRDVTSGFRDDQVQAIGEELRRLGVDLVLSSETEAVADHALRKGYIHPDSLKDIRAEQLKDRTERI